MFGDYQDDGIIYISNIKDIDKKPDGVASIGIKICKRNYKPSLKYLASSNTINLYLKLLDHDGVSMQT